ncbi:MAG TPA: hypothetical protein VK188_16280 [Holophaga sp.]|nr:hypothetical protein [Holophaga sp.]
MAAVEMRVLLASRMADGQGTPCLEVEVLDLKGNVRDKQRTRYLAKALRSARLKIQAGSAGSQVEQAPADPVEAELAKVLGEHLVTLLALQAPIPAGDLQPGTTWRTVVSLKGKMGMTLPLDLRYEVRSLQGDLALLEAKATQDLALEGPLARFKDDLSRIWVDLALTQERDRTRPGGLPSRLDLRMDISLEGRPGSPMDGMFTHFKTRTHLSPAPRP